MPKQLSVAAIILLVLFGAGPAGAQPGAICVQSGVVAGGDHTCAFTLGARAMCWGDNQFGQAGNGTFVTPTPTPTAVSSFEPDAMTVAGQPHVHSFVAGQRHTCSTSGAIELVPGCWGDNRLGQLAADQIPGPANTCPFGFGMCTAFRVAVHGSDGVAHFGGVSALAAGDQHSCMLWGGNVLCWGDDSFGQLGDGQVRAGGPFDHVSVIPVFLPPPQDPLTLDISAGGFHTCSRMDDNTARCWGDNRFGQIGNGGASSQPVARPNVVLASDGNPLPDVRLIAAGERHSCALIANDGFVSCWGDNSLGQIGQDTATTPTAAKAAMVFYPSGQSVKGVEITAGMFHTCVLNPSGTVQCWGSNAKGQLGPGVGVGARSFTPTTVTDANGNPLSGVAHIAAGSNHTCASLVGGGIQCWGDNSSGQLGASTAPATLSATPLAVGGVCTCAGLTSCNGQCSDMTSDPGNCGRCGRVCPSGICTNGACVDGAICRQHCEDANATCQDNCVADFESCPAETPRLNCVQAYRLCVKSCRDERGRCVANCG
jgi:alpha-tubulin suppressor-like RCC1 family protein